MNLKQQIEKDFIEAYKAKEENKVSVLRLIKSSIKNTEINEKHELDDEAVMKILKKEIKQREDSISEYEKAGRSELAQKESAEAELIKAYLPEQLSLEETKQIVTDIISELGATNMADMGKVIGQVMQKAGAKVDGSKVSILVKEVLSNK